MKQVRCAVCGKKLDSKLGGWKGKIFITVQPHKCEEVTSDPDEKIQINTFESKISKDEGFPETAPVEVEVDKRSSEYIRKELSSTAPQSLIDFVKGGIK